MLLLLLPGHVLSWPRNLSVEFCPEIDAMFDVRLERLRLAHSSLRMTTASFGERYGSFTLLTNLSPGVSQTSQRLVSLPLCGVTGM